MEALGREWQRVERNTSAAPWRGALAGVAAALLLCPQLVWGGVKGAPEGTSGIRVGERAPLETAELREAHASGKAIILMFGNPWHCLHCERTWFNIKEVLPRYENDVALVMVAALRVKLWEPPDENVRLARRYGIIGEPWIFLIDRTGVVRKILIGFTERRKIEAELASLLGF